MQGRSARVRVRARAYSSARLGSARTETTHGINTILTQNVSVTKSDLIRQICKIFLRALNLPLNKRLCLQWLPELIAVPTRKVRRNVVDVMEIEDRRRRKKARVQ